MLFNSFEFGVFVVAVFVLYWVVLIGRTRSQNVLILLASYLFYGWWDWRFLALILASSVVDFGLAGHSVPRCEVDDDGFSSSRKAPFASGRSRHSRVRIQGIHDATAEQSGPLAVGGDRFVVNWIHDR